MSIFKGAATAIITPFNADGSVDYDTFGKVIEDQIAGGIDAIVVCGTTGESSTLTHEEHLDVIKYCVEKVNKRVPVVGGTGSNCTETAIYLSQEAEKIGVDGILVVTPYYNKATQKGLYEHYKAIAESVSVPLIMYNVPSRTGCNIAPETAVKLAKDVKNIVAIKEASGNISQAAKLMALADGCIDMYSGNDDQVIPLMSLGGIGVISVLSNVAPGKTHEMCQKFFDGDVKGALDIQLKAIPLVDALFCEVNPIPVKAAMTYKGLCGPTLRRPLTVMEDAHQEVLKKCMDDFGCR